MYNSWRSVALSIAFLLFVPFFASAGSSPIGTFDLADSSQCMVAGWARDPDTTASIQVHVYKDGEFYQGGTFIASFAASTTRSDLRLRIKTTGSCGHFLRRQDSTIARITASICTASMPPAI